MSGRGETKKTEWDEDYVTRCICEYKHDDGFMICCDECSVWQHVECMQIDPRNVPENYLCEQCDPRPVDKKKAKSIQMKKREELTDLSDDGSTHSSMSSSKLKGQLRKKKPRKALGKNGKEMLRKPKEEQLGNRGKKLGRISERLPLSVRDEPGKMLWNCSTSPWSDPYELVGTNKVSEQVKTLVQLKMSHVKNGALVMSKNEFSTKELRQPNCAVADVQRKRKGVVTDNAIEPGTLVMVYKGKYTLKRVVAAELNLSGKPLWKDKPCPFVYCYNRISGIDLVIDARHQGNIARFIRRCCTANCELRHLLVEGLLYIGVFATQDISSGDELTLPFDFELQYDTYEYALECPCSQKTSCPVESLNQALASGKKSSSSAEKSRQPSTESTSAGSSRKRRRTTSSLNSPSAATVTLTSEENEGNESSHDGGDIDSDQKSLKKKTREERKLEVYLKMINSMEKQEKQEHKKEGEGDRVKGKRNLKKPPPLSMDHNSAFGCQEGPGGDGMGTCGDVPSSLYSLGLVMISSTLHLSPPPSPPPRPKPKMDFKVRPHMHSGYMFGNFPPTLKKSLLTRWMRDSQFKCVHKKSVAKPSHPSTHVSLKKKLLKKYFSEHINSKDVRLSSLPMKRQVISRWKTELDRVEKETKIKSPLFEDFSDDESFACSPLGLREPKTGPHEGRPTLPEPAHEEGDHRPGPRTPSTTPPDSPDSSQEGKVASNAEAPQSNYLQTTASSSDSTTEAPPNVAMATSGEVMDTTSPTEVSLNFGLSDESSQQPPSKKKVSLLEYRKYRSKKANEPKRQPSGEASASSTPDGQPQHHLDALSEALTTLAKSLPSSLIEEGNSNLMTSLLPAQHFEPVSPDAD